MKNNKAILGGSICAVTIFLIQIFLRAIDTTKFSIQISVTVLLLFGVAFAIGMIRSKNNVFGLKLNRIAAVLILITCIIISAEIIYTEGFPILAKAHPLLTLIISIFQYICTIAFAIFMIVAASITAKKNEK